MNFETMALRDDAERYRWWRANWVSTTVIFPDDLEIADTPEKFDAAIDARKKETT